MKNLTHACQHEQFTTNDPENTKEREMGDGMVSNDPSEMLSCASRSTEGTTGRAGETHSHNMPPQNDGAG